MAFAMLCSSPTDKDLQWRTSIDLPVTANKKFILGALMDTLFFNKIQALRTTTYDTTWDTTKTPKTVKSITTVYDTSMVILKAYPLYDSAAKKTIPDTVAFGIPTKDTAQYKISEDSLADKYFTDVFGPLPLSGAPNDTLTVPLTGNYTANTPMSSGALPVTLTYVIHIVLMDTPQTANVTIVNNSAAAFSTVSISAGNLGTSATNNLAAHSIGVVQFDARAKVLDNVMTVSITVTPAANGTFAAGDNLQAIFSLNGLVATKVVALDYVFSNFQRTFTNDYKLTDTVSVDYIDIAKGFFNYLVTNNTDLELNMLVNHRNLWMSDYCIRHVPPLTSISTLVGLTDQDSLNYYEGEVTPTIVVIKPGQTAKVSSKENLSGFRMFPEWEWNTHDLDSESVTKVDYVITIGQHGDTVTINAGDSLNFIIRTTSFKFDKMFGISRIAYRRTADAKNIPVNLPWSKSVTDSLRNNFVLQKVFANMAMNVNIPAGAFIDTMRVLYTISSVTDTTVNVPDSEVFTHVSKDSVYRRSIDITKVVNNYPDSVRIKASTVVPTNTTLLAVNDLTNPLDTDYIRYVGRMIVQALANYSLVAPLCWKVVDTTVMDLGGIKVALGDSNNALLVMLRRLRDRHDAFNVKVTNFTNLDLKLYSLVATDPVNVHGLVDTADKANYISTNTLSNYINSPPSGFFNLLGNTGLLIPQRDSNTTVNNSVVVNDADLDKLLRADTIGLRWEVRFLPKKNANGVIDTSATAFDALLNTDWIKLNSWFHIDGINSLDSLFKK